MRTAPAVELLPVGNPYEASEAAHLAGLHHTLDLGDTARHNGWQLSQGVKGFDTVRDTAAAFDEICTTGVTGTATLAPEVLPLFGFTEQPHSVHTGWYQDRHGRYHQVARAGWQTLGEAGAVQTVVYFNVDKSGRMIPSGRHGDTLGYLRRVVDQPSGTLLSADSIRARHLPAETAGTRGRAFRRHRTN